MPSPIFITPPWEGNTLYPLPPDYADLTREGRRQARVNASRQWLLELPPPLHLTNREWRGFLLSESIRFFDHYYLRPDPDENFDPLFYDETPKASPPFHDDILQAQAFSRFTLSVCPRGSAKTGLGRKVVLTRIITCPAYSYIYATSTGDLAKETARVLRSQCYDNDRINSDFSPEYGGPLKPVRGDNPTGVEHFFLVNGSHVKLTSTGSAQRGIRPRRYLLDDPEYDASGSTSMGQLIADFDRMLFRIIMPMVLRDRAGIDWLATFVSKRHFAWRAMQGRDTPAGFRADDPRFDYWDRLQVNVMERDPTTGLMVSCWPDRWPLSTDPTEELSSSGRVSVEQMRAFMGAEAFNSEMMGNPGDSGTVFFPPLNPEDHHFSYLEVDEALSSNRPRESHSKITWTRRTPGAGPSTYTRVEMPLQTFLQKSRLFICMDWAPTHSPTSDFKTAILMAHLPTHNELFVLDGWSGQVPKAEQIKAAFTLAETWKCPLVYPEVVKDSVVLYNDLVDTAHTRAMDLYGITHVPKIVPLRVGMQTKSEKISSLYLRVEHGLLKLPAHLAHAPWMTRLLDQFASFNPQVADGGLAKDDEIDTCAMSMFVLKTRREDPRALPEVTDPVDALISGAPLPLDAGTMATGINWAAVSPDQARALLAARNPPNSGRSLI